MKEEWKTSVVGAEKKKWMKCILSKFDEDILLRLKRNDPTLNQLENGFD